MQASNSDMLRNFVSMIAGSGYGYIAISSTSAPSMKTLKTEFFPADDLDSIVGYLATIPKSNQVFIGISRMNTKLVQGRGKSVDVGSFSVIGMDIDISDPSKPERNYPESLEAAIDLVEGFQLKPSAIIRSGTGLHVYWVLDSDYLIASSEGLRSGQKIVADFYQGFADYALPFAFDHTHDLARVFRVPGFTNLKDPTIPQIVEAIYIDSDQKHTIADIESVSTSRYKPRNLGLGQSSEVAKPDFSIELMSQGCKWVQCAHENAQKASYAEWFAMGSLLSFSPDGLKEFLEYSSAHPSFDEDECIRQFEQIDPEKAARTCESLAQISGMNGACVNCAFRGGVTSPVELGQPARRSVLISDKQLDEQTAQVWAGVHVNNDPPKLFEANGQLARANRETQEIVALDASAATYALARIVTWLRLKKNGFTSANPSPIVIKDVMATPELPLPHLRRVSALPVLTKDGVVVSTPGYDASSQIFIAPKPGQQIAINHDADQSDAAEAVRFIFEEMLYDFPFADDSSRANALAIMLQPIARELFDGPSPLYLLDKPLAGTGASLLANALCYPYLGRSIPVKTWSASADERRKQITAHLMTGSAVYLWDNISGQVDCDAVASVLTSQTYSDRVLGTSNQVELTNEGLWLATGNNPTFSNQIGRRIARVRLVPQTDTPALRTGFKHEPLMAWVEQNRAQIVSYLYDIVIAWINAGKPKFVGQLMGSYESWSAILGGIIEHAGLPGFLSDTSMQQGSVDTETELLREFIQEWYDRFGTAKVTPTLIVEQVTECELVSEWDGFGVRGQATKAGKYLKTLTDRYVTINVAGQKVLVQVLKLGTRHFRLRHSETT